MEGYTEKIIFDLSLAVQSRIPLVQKGELPGTIRFNHS